ncbi:hypothetical protein [Kutzneria kofuensis]|uniref:hypothetical protein n=1 Tax=Kutzneria kofuensis TaxID=103725 RepID=UPI0031E53216
MGRHAGTGAGLHEPSIEGEGEQRGVTEFAGDVLGLAAACGPRGDRVPRISNATVASKRQREAGMSRQHGQSALGGGDDHRACTGSSLRVQIAGTS